MRKMSSLHRHSETCPKSSADFDHPQITFGLVVVDLITCFLQYDQLSPRTEMLMPPSTATMASAACNENPPTKASSLRKSVCSSFKSTSSFQLIALCSVCYRGGASLLPPVNTSTGCSNQERSAWGDRSLQRAVANSRANPRPLAENRSRQYRVRSHQLTGTQATWLVFFPAASSRNTAVRKCFMPICNERENNSQHH